MLPLVKLNVPALVFVKEPLEPLSTPLKVRISPEETSIVLPELNATALDSVNVAVLCNIPDALIVTVPEPILVASLMLKVPVLIVVPASYELVVVKIRVPVPSPPRVKSVPDGRANVPLRVTLVLSDRSSSPFCK